MSRIFRDSSVLNQFGSPSLNSNTLANRPAFGQVGRLFVDTTNNVIYRDTGTSWDLIGGGGGSQNLQQVTTIGNTTDQGINVLSNSGLYVTSDGNISNRPTTYPFAVYAVGFNVLKSTYNVNDANINVAAILQSNINVDVTSTKNTFFNANFSNLDINIPTGSTLTLGSSANNGAVLALNSFSGAGGGSIVNSQAGGSGFRAISPLISKTNYTSLTNNITIDYYAGINIYGAEGITSTGKLSIGQYYSLLINPSDYFANSPIITGNRFGIYQAGANDKNYFASQMYINSKYIQLGGTITNTSNSLIIDNNGSNYRIQNYDGNDFLICPIGNNVYIGANSFFGAKLNVDGSIYSNNTLFANSLNLGNSSIIIDYDINGGKIQSYSSKPIILNNLGNNVLIGTTTDTGRKLVVNGNVEILTTTATGVHTPTSQHLPIYVNGTLYYLQLLN
jgi:hypothetical protein